MEYNESKKYFVNARPSAIYQLFLQREFFEVIRNPSPLAPKTTQRGLTQKNGDQIYASSFAPLGWVFPIRFDVRLHLRLVASGTPDETLDISVTMASLPKPWIGIDGNLRWVFQLGIQDSRTIWLETIGGSAGVFRASPFLVFGHKKLMTAAAKNMGILGSELNLNKTQTGGQYSEPSYK